VRRRTEVWEEGEHEEGDEGRETEA
jgi:hypothetical protein